MNDELFKTITMALYNNGHFDTNNPMATSAELAEKVIQAISEKHTFKCKDCGLEHMLDGQGNWRALKPS